MKECTQENSNAFWKAIESGELKKDSILKNISKNMRVDLANGNMNIRNAELK